jgi:hypothetical protein
MTRNGMRKRQDVGGLHPELEKSNSLYRALLVEGSGTLRYIGCAGLVIYSALSDQVMDA